MTRILCSADLRGFLFCSLMAGFCFYCFFVFDVSCFDCDWPRFDFAQRPCNWFRFWRNCDRLHRISVLRKINRTDTERSRSAVVFPKRGRFICLFYCDTADRVSLCFGLKLYSYVIVVIECFISMIFSSLSENDGKNRQILSENDGINHQNSSENDGATSFFKGLGASKLKRYPQRITPHTRHIKQIQTRSHRISKQPRIRFNSLITC